ncbi:hypothetical protein [Nocardia brevicatena]|uniref:hypothetical protein n=1 Tax=Nocardia brevicatena TaxID=37327 RepID=UPI0002F98459|nr:hypothetical protein [Nocardia brevicatena]
MGWWGESSWIGWTVTAVCVLAFWTLVVGLATVLFRGERSNSTIVLDPARQGGVRLHPIEEGLTGDIDVAGLLTRRRMPARLPRTVRRTGPQGQRGGRADPPHMHARLPDRRRGRHA